MNVESVSIILYMANSICVDQAAQRLHLCSASYTHMLFVHGIYEVFSRDSITIGMPLTEIIPYHIKEQ